MTIKEQNAQLTEIKAELEASLHFAIEDIIETLLGGAALESQIDLILDYLLGGLSLKELRAKINKVSLPVQKNVKAPAEKVPTQKSIKVPTKKVAKSKKAK